VSPLPSITTARAAANASATATPSAAKLSLGRPLTPKAGDERPSTRTCVTARDTDDDDDDNEEEEEEEIAGRVVQKKQARRRWRILLVK
jgi:hypothetical protein